MMPPMTLMLRLAAPTQAWDSHRRPATPAAGRSVAIPTPGPAGRARTGVAGLLACALGRPRETDRSDLIQLHMLVRVDQPGQPRGEFRTSRRRAPSGKVVTVPQVETVLDDAAFLVGIDGPAELLDQIGAALEQPRWALYLGKREFPPTLPLTVGTASGGVETALRSHPWIAADWYRRTQPRCVSLSLAEPRVGRARDVHLEPITLDNPAGQPERIDWFAALG